MYVCMTQLEYMCIPLNSAHYCLPAIPQYCLYCSCLPAIPQYCMYCRIAALYTV